MVRKTTRVAALKANEKTKRESPRRSRRRKSTSESSSSEEEALANVAQKQKKPVQKDTSDESDTDSRKPLKKRTRSKAVSESKTKQNDTEPSQKKSKESSNRRTKNKKADVDEVNEDDVSKGKSVSIDRCNSDSVDSETPNQNVQASVQVTDESPIDTKDDDNLPDDEVSKNGKEIPTEIDVNISESIVAEFSCGSQSEIVSEETTEVLVTEHSVSDLPREEDAPDLTQSNEEEPSVNNQEITIQSVDNDNEGSQAESAKKISVNSEPEPEESKIAEESQDDNSKQTASGTRKIKLIRKAVEPVAEPQTNPSEETEPKKKITLKRPEISKPEEKQADNSDSKSPSKQEPQGSQWGSVYESNNKESVQPDQPSEPSEPKSTKKKIILKRPASDDQSERDKNDKVALERSSSQEESRDRKRRLSTTDNIVINQRRRRSSVVEKSASESEDKPEKIKKPTKIVKLNRKLPQVPEETLPSAEDPGKKFKWGKIHLSHEVEVIQFESVKEICPTVGFLEETEVDLELEVKKSPEKTRRMTFKELEEEEMESIEAELNAEPEKMEVNENVIARNRKISVVDDTASKLNPPPSPPRNPTSEVLFITNLVRPFTVKQLKELLERTGKIKEDGFWTDKIKSKCYVCYETVEEAEATRNALHGIHWPIGNGKKLNIDYATLEDMEKAKNPPLPLPPKEKSPEKENKNPDMHERREEGRDVRSSKREWDLGKGEEQLRHARSRSRDRGEKKHRRSYTPEIHHKKRKHEEQMEQKAMDDLFLKTKATPSIYWQPLSPEEIALKQQQRQARLEENKRRLEEIRSSGRGSFRDRTVRDRNFRRR